MKRNVAALETPFRCDCVAMKRKIQAEIYEETKDMTREERRARTRKASEEFWAGVERCRAELAKSGDN